MFRGDGKLRQETNDHVIGPKKHAKGDQRADPRNPEGYGTGKEAETSYSHSNRKKTSKADFIRNAYDIAAERTKQPPHPENEIPLTRERNHLLRSEREFGGGLAGTPKEAEKFRNSIRGQRRDGLEYAMRMDDYNGHTQGSRDYIHYMELYGRNDSSHNPGEGSHGKGEPSDRRRLPSDTSATWEGEPYRRQLSSATWDGKPYRRSPSSSSDTWEGEPRIDADYHRTRRLHGKESHRIDADYHRTRRTHRKESRYIDAKHHRTHRKESHHIKAHPRHWTALMMMVVRSLIG